jgi:hypothetical protein
MSEFALVLRVKLQKLNCRHTLMLRNEMALLPRVKKQFVIRQGAC